VYRGIVGATIGSCAPAHTRRDAVATNMPIRTRQTNGSLLGSFVNRLVEAVQLRLHQGDAGLKLQLRLPQRQTFAVDVHVVAIGSSVSPATSIHPRRRRRRILAGQRVSWLRKSEVAA